MVEAELQLKSERLLQELVTQTSSVHKAIFIFVCSEKSED